MITLSLYYHAAVQSTTKTERKKKKIGQVLICTHKGNDMNIYVGQETKIRMTSLTDHSINRPRLPEPGLLRLDTFGITLNCLK